MNQKDGSYIWQLSGIIAIWTILLFTYTTDQYKCTQVFMRLKIPQSFTQYLYSLPIAAVTNYHRPRGLKQQILIFLQFWRPEFKMSSTGLKSKCQQGKLLLELSRENPFLTSFTFWGLLAFLGFQPPLLSLCFYGYFVFSSVVGSPSSFCR